MTLVRTPLIDPTARGASSYGGRGDPELWVAEAEFVQPNTRGTTDDTDYNLCCLTLRGLETPTPVVQWFLGRVALPLGVRERAGYASVSSVSVSRPLGAIFRWG